MQSDYDPAYATYQPAECGEAMNNAVDDLAKHTGKLPSDFVGQSMANVFEAAQEAYPELPEFWRVWAEWHAPQPRPEMGDL